MRGLFDCDTLWCCWMEAIRLLGEGLWYLRWPAAIYATLYIMGALSFLVSLKLKSQDGKLTVKTDSWAYMIAHPMRYGGHRDKDTNRSICAFYARMLNMLLFVWPFLLVYFLFISVAGNIFSILIFGAYLVPNLAGEGFFEVHKFWDIPTIVISLPIFIIGSMAYNFWGLLHFLERLGWNVACASPIWGPIVIGIGLVLYVRNRRILSEPERGEQVSALRETFLSHKHRFCKLIEFK